MVVPSSPWGVNVATCAPPTATSRVVGASPSAWNSPEAPSVPTTSAGAAASPAAAARRRRTAWPARRRPTVPAFTAARLAVGAETSVK